MGEERESLLVVVAGAYRVGLPLRHVLETMRPLPVEPLRDAPPFVLGLAIIRGASVPVVDLGSLLGRQEDTFSRRFVSLRVEGRPVALALDAVLDVVEFERDAFSLLPPLLAHAASDAVRELCLADQKLLLVLEASRLLSRLPAEAEGAS